MIQQKHQQISTEHLSRSTSSPLLAQQLKVKPNPNATCTITSGTPTSTVTSATPKTLVTSVAQQNTANAIELHQPEYTFKYISPVDPELNALLLQNQDNNLFGNTQLIDPNSLETSEFLYSSTEPEFTGFVSDYNLPVNADDETVLNNKVDNRQEILQEKEKDGQENLEKDLEHVLKENLDNQDVEEGDEDLEKDDREKEEIVNEQLQNPPGEISEDEEFPMLELDNQAAENGEEKENVAQCNGCRELLKNNRQQLLKLNEMCEEIKQIKTDYRTLKEIVENQSRGEEGAGGRDRPIDLLPQLPIQDVEVFEKFNRDLETNDLMQTQLKNFMTSIGGKTLKL